MSTSPRHLLGVTWPATALAALAVVLAIVASDVVLAHALLWSFPAQVTAATAQGARLVFESPAAMFLERTAAAATVALVPALAFTLAALRGSRRHWPSGLPRIACYAVILAVAGGLALAARVLLIRHLVASFPDGMTPMIPVSELGLWRWAAVAVCLAAGGLLGLELATRAR